MKFHAVTWVEGDFTRTARILSFESRAHRDVYRGRSGQRYEPISYEMMRQLARAYPRVSVPRSTLVYA